MSNEQILNQLNGNIAWKDKQFQYLGCNLNFSKSLGLKKCKNIIGLNDEALMDIASPEYKLHQQNDIMALAGKNITGLHYCQNTKKMEKYFFINKKPLFFHKEIKGLIFQCQEISIYHEFYPLLRNHGKNKMDNNVFYRYSTFDNIFNLSRRELECLYYLLRGLSAKEIGIRLLLSKRTVESYIENIKIKFNCNNKTDLILKASEMGYQYILPSSLDKKLL